MSVVAVLNILQQGHAPALFKAEQQLHTLDYPVVEPLIELLYHEDTHIRRNAAWLLRKFGDDVAVDFLVEALFDDDAKVRQFAAIALGHLENPQATDSLMAALADENVAVRLNAIRALGRIQDPVAINPLISILQNKAEDKEVQATAAQALGQLGATQAIKALYNALNDRHTSIHAEAALALARIGQPALKKLLKAVKNHKKSYRQRRRSAAMALGLMVGGGHLQGHPNLITQAVEALIAESGSTSKRMRCAIAQALAATGDLRAVEPLVVGLRYDTKTVRRCAARALHYMAEHATITLSAIVNPLLEALSDPDQYVRLTSVEALGLLHDSRAIEPLFNCLEHEDPEMRYRAVQALGHIHDPGVVKPITRLLRDKDEWMRSYAAQALGTLRHPRAVKPLVVALSDPAAHVRVRAANSLGQIGDPHAIRALQERLSDEDGRVRQAAEVALKELSA